MSDKDINFPGEICEIVDKFREARLEKERVAKQAEQKRAEEERRMRAERLKNGLIYAARVFNWSESFRKSDVGKELMDKSHIPTAYNNIFFFDGHVEGTNWVGLVVSPRGLSLNRGGRWSSLSEQKIKSSSDLAVSVDTRILKMACEWIDDGKVWECIIRHFGYLNKNNAD